MADDVIDILQGVAHRDRIAILKALSEESRLSPSETAARAGLPLGNVSYHYRELLKRELVYLVDTQQRRGALEHFYALSPNGRIAIKAVRTVEHDLRRS